MNDSFKKEAIAELEMFERFSCETCRDIVQDWKDEPKHETVEQWEKRTGESYHHDYPVRVYNDDGSWEYMRYRKAITEKYT